MTSRQTPDVIGTSAAGWWIITSTGCCANFERQESALACARECWYCKYADFRENTALQKHYGTCRRKSSKPSVKLSDEDLDEVVGGVSVESDQASYQCQCGAVFSFRVNECPICYNREIQKIQ
ncbi:hypothetical protein FRZ06_06455 [Anoxybacterium hadale]|uniref:Uncharacterized protein n=1 Tax=Anoxybacterium hadale TaxID=3408580 RepID=A0ACD1A997_9FIRM|nr:hypothetical protein FRZ06_06455 [Clostridiales bacterium]